MTLRLCAESEGVIRRHKKIWIRDLSKLFRKPNMSKNSVLWLTVIYYHNGLFDIVES